MEIFNNLQAFLWQSRTANNCNTYLIDDSTSRVLIDPGHSQFFGHVTQGLDQLGLKTDDIDLVICTHAHPDHIEAVQLFKDIPNQFALHEDEWQWAASIGKQMSAAFGIDMASLAPDFFLKEGDISVGGLELNILHTPGHSPGSITIYWPDRKALFTGDLVFKEGLGRTDLPGGNGSKIKESIKRLGSLDVEWLLPGHGEIVSGAENVHKNLTEIEQFYFAYV